MHVLINTKILNIPGSGQVHSSIFTEMNLKFTPYYCSILIKRKELTSGKIAKNTLSFF